MDYPTLVTELARYALIAYGIRESRVFLSRWLERGGSLLQNPQRFEESVVDLMRSGRISGDLIRREIEGAPAEIRG